MKLTNLHITTDTASLKKLGLGLLIPFASLLSHTWLSIPPTLVLFFGAVIVTLLIFNNQFQSPRFKTEKLSENPYFKTILIIFGFSLYLFISQYLIESPIRRYIGTLTAPLYLALILILANGVDRKYIEKLVNKFINYSVYILSFEAIVRIAVSIYKILEGTNPYYSFYRFKYFGPVYMESNATATHLICLLFFTFWWSKRQNITMHWQKIVIFILIFFTFSRTCVVTLALGFIFYFFFYKYNWKKVAFATIISLFLLILATGLSLDYINDFSLKSKFQILNEAFEYFRTISPQKFLFGVGLSKSMDYMTFYAHNYFLVFLMEAGLFSFLYICFLFFHFIKKTNGHALIIILPFIIQTATSTITFIPFFFTIIGIIFLFTNPSTLTKIQENTNDGSLRNHSKLQQQ